MDELEITTVVGFCGLALGLIFGATAQKTHFCTMGAISDMVFMGDLRRMRSWLLSIAIAIIGTQALHATGTIDIYGAIYLTPTLGWAGAIIGGGLFGFGMTLAGGCGNKTLVRVGGGNLKSIVVFLIMGVVAYMTLRGLFGLVRVEIEQATNVDLTASGLESQGLPDMLAAATGLGLEVARWVVTAVIAGGLIAFCFKDADFRSSGANLAAGVIIGLLIPAGWYATGVIGFDEFAPTQISSFTFVGPTGESVQYMMTYTGATINFGIAAVGGVIAGSFLMSLATKTFNVESFIDANDMLRHIVGATMMGFGGVLALGCTIGQGITGMSTLALGSVIALLSILGGGIYGMKYLEEGSLVDAAKAVFSRG